MKVGRCQHPVRVPPDLQHRHAALPSRRWSVVEVVAQRKRLGLCRREPETEARNARR